VRPVHSKPHRVEDGRVEQTDSDETIPVLVWLDDGQLLPTPHHPLPADTMKSHLGH
jgi:hypothetical protein